MAAKSASPRFPLLCAVWCHSRFKRSINFGTDPVIFCDVRVTIGPPNGSDRAIADPSPRRPCRSLVFTIDRAPADCSGGRAWGRSRGSRACTDDDDGFGSSHSDLRNSVSFLVAMSGFGRQKGGSFHARRRETRRQRRLRFSMDGPGQRSGLAHGPRAGRALRGLHGAGPGR